MAKNIQERLIKLSLDENWHCFHSTFQQNKYYIPYPHMIRKCYVMSMNERGVLLDILESIACNLGISESTVKSAITSLEEKKFIKTVRRRGQVNRYRIDQLEANPYLVLSENVHFFLKLYHPRYIKKTLIQSVIATIINGDSYKSYANRLYEAYHSKQPYLDVSTQGQAKDGYSLGYQQDEIRLHCERQGWNLLQVFTDEGISGAKVDEAALEVDRIGFQNMLAALSAQMQLSYSIQAVSGGLTL